MVPENYIFPIMNSAAITSLFLATYPFQLKKKVFFQTDASTVVSQLQMYFAVYFQLSS